MAITDSHPEKGRKRQRIPHLLIVKGSWRNLRRPPGYPIRPYRPHTVAGSTSLKVVSPKLGPLAVSHRAANVQYVLRRTLYRQLIYLCNRLLDIKENIPQRPRHNLMMPIAAPVTPLTMP